MEIIPFVHEGLGNSSYLVALNADTASLIDPDRSVGRYLRAAEARGLRISTVFETHLHADFVTGSLEIANATGAAVFVPGEGGVRYPHQPLQPGERVPLEGAQVEAVASPGHTPEHLSYVFRRQGYDSALFSGGSLIVGGAARTDLVSPALTNELTHAQYHTLREAFSALPDDTLLYPTHGGGSFCSAGSGGERTSTLGRERASNPMLSIQDEEEFARWFPTTFPAAPSYFFHMRPINQAGPRLRREIADPPALAPEEFRRRAEGGLIVDLRSTDEYARAHIGGSLSNMFRSSYATWLGWLVPLGTPLLFVTDSVPLENILDETLLVGHERFVGWLDGGITAWEVAGLPLQSIEVIDAESARKMIADGAAALDVRELGEFASGHVQGADHVPLGSLQQHLDDVPRDRPVVTYCGMGERATSAASILERAGFRAVLNLKGGVRAWKEAGYELAV